MTSGHSENGSSGPGTASDYGSSKVLLAFLKSCQREPAMREPIFQALPLPNGLILVTHPIVDYVFIDSSDIQFLPHYALGNYQERATIAIQHHFCGGERVLHVGAQTGYHTLTLARRVGDAGSVLALEASGAFTSVLATNISSHRLGDRVSVAKLSENVPGSLLDLLMQPATEIDSIYITEDVPIPPAWQSDLAEFASRRPFAKIVIGSRVHKFESLEALQIEFFGLANKSARKAA